MPHPARERCSTVRVLIHLHNLHAVRARCLRNILDFSEYVLVRNFDFFLPGKTVQNKVCPNVDHYVVAFVFQLFSCLFISVSFLLARLDGLSAKLVSLGSSILALRSESGT